MRELIRELEELSFRTLPALEQEHYDDWVLRWSDGGSRRANSVTPLGPSSLPLDEKVAHCEEWFDRRGGRCIFRLTPLADARIEPELRRRGYAKTSPTDVMILEIEPTSIAPEVSVTDRPSPGWLRLVTGLDPAHPEAVRLADQLLAGDGQLRFAVVSGAADEILSAGLSIDLDRFTTIYNMHTTSVDRRRGLASLILSTLLAEGRESGSTHAVLQVTQDNEPAQTLYRKFGFSPIYEYRYMER